jgi:uncharacterized membrane protein
MELTVILLCLLGVGLLLGIGRRKGFRALVSLGLTVLVLTAVVIPLIVRGFDPELVILTTAVPLLAMIVYGTEGFNALSHVSVAAAALTFVLTSVLTEGAVLTARLTGLVSDETSSVAAGGIDIRQLLAAGIMLGTLGVLTEMAVTQVATVFELAAAHLDPPASLVRRAHAVGMAHLGSIVTTLFLVYAGVSLPTLVLFAGAHGSLTDALHYEPLVEEIVRTLVGTIGLILAMPIATRLAILWISKKSPPVASTHS